MSACMFCTKPLIGWLSFTLPLFGVQINVLGIKVSFYQGTSYRYIGMQANIPPCMYEWQLARVDQYTVFFVLKKQNLLI